MGTAIQELLESAIYGPGVSQRATVTTFQTLVDVQMPWWRVGNVSRAE